jgi:hypothetical protein
VLDGVLEVTFKIGCYAANLVTSRIAMHRVDNGGFVDPVTMDLGTNYIKFSEADLNRRIYRVFSVSRFFELLASGQNTLVRPARWDDPFENFILRSTANYQGRSVHFDFKDHLYGQCWTLHKESDAMWRIYSQQKDGLTVRTTVRKLLESLAVSVGPAAPVSCFIGRVQYRPETELVGMVKDQELMSEDLMDPSGSGQAWTLMWKRREFRHEKEVRLVYFNHDKNFTSDFFTYKIDPLVLFERIIFDPRIAPEVYEVFRIYLEGRGFSGRVSRSNLYRLPQLELNLVRGA